jgi:hypothetical protein
MAVENFIIIQALLLKNATLAGYLLPVRGNYEDAVRMFP